MIFFTATVGKILPIQPKQHTISALENLSEGLLLFLGEVPLEKEMPDQFLLNMSGTKMVFEGEAV
jgi:hypothetical protein